MTVRSASVSALLVALALTAPAAARQTAPQAFDLVATVSTGAAAKGGITVPMTVMLDRFTPDFERAKMTDGLKYNGYPGFLTALREAPQVGTLEVAGETFKIRWARERDTAAGRVISLVTDQPVAFVGSGKRGAKPTAGYEVAVLQFTLDKVGKGAGKGTGTMAAAARVKPGGDTGVRIDSYAEKPMTLAVTARAAK